MEVNMGFKIGDWVYHVKSEAYCVRSKVVLGEKYKISGLGYGIQVHTVSDVSYWLPRECFNYENIKPLF